MFSVEKTPSSIAFRFSSEIHLVEEVLQKFEKYCHRLNVKEPSSLIVVLQELLKNAVIHGNRKDTNKNVVCTIDKLDERRFRVAVEDKGSGFDYRNLDMSPPDDLKHIQRRGYAIINALSDRIEFNESGNKITTFLTITNEKNGGMGQ